MSRKQQIKQYRALNKWFQSPLGLFAAHEFALNLDLVQAHLRGQILLQLGNCGANPWLKKLNFNSKWIVSPFPLENKIHIESEFNHLPLERNSIDCVMLPLSLEPFANSIGLIDEIDRVLKPMGFVVLLCINPWSLWGGAMKLGLLHCYHDRHVKMHTAFNIHRVFIQRGYSQISLSNFCYIPPVNTASVIKKVAFLDEIGKMLWPIPSGFYCYIAQKHQLIQPTPLYHPIPQPIDDYQSPLQPVALTPKH